MILLLKAFVSRLSEILCLFAFKFARMCESLLVNLFTFFLSLLLSHLEYPLLQVFQIHLLCHFATHFLSFQIAIISWFSKAKIFTQSCTTTCLSLFFSTSPVDFITANPFSIYTTLSHTHIQTHQPHCCHSSVLASFPGGFLIAAITSCGADVRYHRCRRRRRLSPTRHDTGRCLVLWVFNERNSDGGMMSPPRASDDCLHRGLFLGLYLLV